MPKARADLGRLRALPQAVADALISFKDEQPELSASQLIRAVRERGLAPASPGLPSSTVHRLLSRAGLMHKQPSQASSKDRRAFAYARASELWMSGVMHGPSVTLPWGVRRKAYLIAFIDHATRVIPYAAFALAENTQAVRTRPATRFS
jgi:hypothetical protein